jgi:uncharacterized membrane protein YbhN (UPF0104 family)
MNSRSPSAEATDEERLEKQDERGFVSNWRYWLLAALFIAGIVFAVLHWGDVKEFGRLVANAEPTWLLAAVAAQLATYVLLAAQWAVVLRAGNCASPPGKLLSLTLAKHFADQMVPTSGMSGNILVADRLIALGGSKAIAVAAVILAILAYFASYAIGAVTALVLLWLRGESNWIVVALISAFVALTAAVPLFALFLQKKGKDALP